MYAIVASLIVSCAFALPGPKAKGYIPSNKSVPMLSKDDLRSRKSPDYLDWSTQGVTTPIRDQGVCGCCWAFSAAETIESAAKMNGYDLEELSAGQVCRCDTSDQGCNGGNVPTALDYVISANGIDSSANDNYGDQVNDQTTDACAWDGQSVATITGFKRVPQDLDSLASALATYGPLAICINARPWPNQEGSSTWSWTGIAPWADQCDTEEADHCVQLVGYDRTASPPYWKVRNQWGASWGENGYVRLPYNDDNCGIAQEAYIVEGAQLTGSRSSVLV